MVRHQAALASGKLTRVASGVNLPPSEVIMSRLREQYGGGTSMNLTLRPGTPADAERCGTICYEAFKAIADRHQFPPDCPSPQAAVASTERRFSHADYYAVVAELEGRIVGSVFLDEPLGHCECGEHHRRSR